VQGEKASQISVFVIKVPFAYEFLTVVSAFMKPGPVTVQLCKRLLGLYGRA